QPLHHARNPEVLAQRLKHDPKVRVAVELRVVDAVEQAADAACEANLLGRRCSELAQSAVLPDRQRQQRRREPGGERQQSPPFLDQEEQQRPSSTRPLPVPADRSRPTPAAPPSLGSRGRTRAPAPAAASAPCTSGGN